MRAIEAEEAMILLDLAAALDLHSLSCAEGCCASQLAPDVCSLQPRTRPSPPTFHQSSGHTA